MSFKKNSLDAAEQERSDVAAARQCWKAAQASLDANRLVFVDETGNLDQDGAHPRPLSPRPASDRQGGPSFSTCRPLRPILNPIEMAFAKFKTLLRKAAARTTEIHFGTQSPTSSPLSRQTNAQTTSLTQGMLRPR